MRTVFIRRGPWGYIWEHHPDMATSVDWRVVSLAELPSLVAEGQPVRAFTVVFQS
jgi:FMN hydrolase / 5-amino-6-(5-phospho-D-ribitylamino)uracil phosphatase